MRQRVNLLLSEIAALLQDIHADFGDTGGRDRDFFRLRAFILAGIELDDFLGDSHRAPVVAAHGAEIGVHLQVLIVIGAGQVRIETQIEQINVKEVLHEVLLDLQEMKNASNASVANQNQVGYLSYNRRGLKHILTNLIGNAIKFSAYQKDAQVVIGSEEREREFLFYVKDNGIGIDKQYHQCIFDLFYRLQELKNVEGTGVGLTIVQRVLETYGGKVWLESEKGKGATFYFSIPKSDGFATT